MILEIDRQVVGLAKVRIRITYRDGGHEWMYLTSENQWQHESKCEEIKLVQLIGVEVVKPG